MRTELAAEVSRGLEDYIQGTRDGDGDLLLHVFLPDAMVAEWFGEDLVLRRPDGFIDRAESTEAGPSYRACVASV